MPDISRLVIEVDSHGVLKATGNLDEFTRKSRTAGQSTDDLANKFGAFQLIVNKLPGPLKSVAAGLMGMMNPATAAISAILEIGNAVKQSVATFADFETVKTNLEMVMGSAEQASATFNKLQRIAKNSMFGTEQLVSAASMLKNFGVSTRELIPTIEMLGNAAGGNAQKFDQVAQAYARMISMGEANAATIKQLTSAGIPIRKMLDEIGVSGNATADQIKEAFRRMTDEGGVYFNAMGRMSDTLKGKISGLETVWKTYQATWAENSGLGTLWKIVISELTNEIEKQTDAMVNNKKAADLMEKRKNGDHSDRTEYEYASAMIKSLNGNYIDRMIAASRAVNSFGVRAIYEDYSILVRRYQEIKDNLQTVIDKENEQIKNNEEFNDILERRAKMYSDLKDTIAEAYAETPEGQKESVEDKIKMWQERLKETHLEPETHILDNGNKQIFMKEVGITEEEKNRIEAIINMLTKSLKNSKDELTSWQKIFKSAMGLTDTDTKQNWFSSQSKAINKFAQTLNTIQERSKILSVTIGTDFAGSLEKAAEQWEQLAGEMILSGEWQANNDPFLQVVEYAREARETLGEANLDRLIADTNKEIGLLKMTTNEMEKQKIISEYKVTNEHKINEALRTQNILLDEQKRLSMLSSATGIPEEKLKGLSSTELYNTTIDNFNEKLLDANVMKYLGIGDYVSDLNSIEKSFEEIVRTVTSSDFRNLYTEIIKSTIPDFSVMSAEEVLDALSKFGISNLDDMGNSFNEILGEKLKEFQDIVELFSESLEDVRNVIKEEKEKADYIKNGYNYMVEITTQINDALHSIRENLQNGQKITKEQYGQYAEGRFAKAGMDLIQGSDAGNFVEGTQMGGPIVGLINMLAGALTNVLGGMEGMELILNPITNMLKKLTPLIKALMLPLILFAKILEWVSAGLMKLLNWITGGLFDRIADFYDTLAGTNDERKKEEERLKALNEQYRKLYSALREQEEYYLQQRQHLNAEWAIENYQTRNVNDMILTPNGAFSTDPKDYIIATKHPETLAGGASPVFITVINKSDSNVSTRESTDSDGARNIQIVIDQVVQSGLAGGRYDNALDAASSRRAGKRVMSGW